MKTSVSSAWIFITEDYTQPSETPRTIARRAFRVSLESKIERTGTQLQTSSRNARQEQFLTNTPKTAGLQKQGLKPKTLRANAL